MRVSATLDRYVGKYVLGSFLASLLFFSFLTVLIDLLNNLGRYIEQAERQEIGTLAMFWMLGELYLKRMPVQFVMIAPFATVIGCMFAITRLMAQNELQPMLFVGRSMARILRPALVCGVLSALAMGACWQWVVPRVASDVTASLDVLSGGDREIRNLVFEQRGDSFVGLRVARYDAEARRMEGVSLLRRGSQPKDAESVVATSAVWNPQRRDWQLNDGQRTTSEGVTDDWPWLGVTEWTPDELVQRGRESIDCELFSYDELLELRRLRPTRRDVTMALHRHVTYPLANLILLLLALPFAIHFERGSRIERVLCAIGVCAAYLLFDLTCQNLGYNDWVHPVVAAWSPTILFGSLGVVMFGGVRT